MKILSALLLVTLIGASACVAATRQERQRVVKNCLRNRGYSVLN